MNTHNHKPTNSNNINTNNPPLNPSPLNPYTQPVSKNSNTPLSYHQTHDPSQLKYKYINKSPNYFRRKNRSENNYN